MRDFLFSFQLVHKGIVGTAKSLQSASAMHMRVREAAAAVFQLLRALERRGERAERAKGSKQSSMFRRLQHHPHRREGLHNEAAADAVGARFPRQDANGISVQRSRQRHAV